MQGSGRCEACAVPVVADRAERVRTLAAGVIIDPNISTPLPFAGLSYVDFNLLGTGAQLNAFFGGSYGQLAFSVPSLGGTRWQLAGRAFGIASSYHDRAFSAGREIYAENIRQRPAHASVWLLKPLTPRISIRAGYELDYTRFASSDTTGASFVVPAAQIVHGARFAIDGQRAGWNGSVWWDPAVRSGWREWGTAGTGDYNAGHGTFQRYGLTVARSAVLTPRLGGPARGGLDGRAQTSTVSAGMRLAHSTTACVGILPLSSGSTGAGWLVARLPGRPGRCCGSTPFLIPRWSAIPATGAVSGTIQAQGPRPKGRRRSASSSRLNGDTESAAWTHAARQGRTSSGLAHSRFSDPGGVP